MSFLDVFNRNSWNEVQDLLSSQTSNDVERALHTTGKRSVADFAALISSAAEPYLEQMAQRSHAMTLRRFGRTMQMYAPCYLSNECQNICTYCGFSYNNKIERLTLSDDQIVTEIEAIKALGYNHVLLVTGESQKKVGLDYFKNALTMIRPRMTQISMEVQPLLEEEYQALASCGVSGVLVYQETYNRDAYAGHHPKGRKSNFEFRLETPDRLGRAGMRKIGLGALFGLSDWRVDSFFVGLHLDYLERAYWKSRYAISFPRLRPAEGVVGPKSMMSDKQLVQLICAFRIFNENVELSLSTRENPRFRDNAIKLGITSMSAGSKTDPGGYAVKKEALKQFEISDERSPDEVAAMVRASGYEPVWKDWDAVYV